MLTPEIISRALLSSFAASLESFERYWSSGWDKGCSPGHERACVSRVAIEMTNLFSDELEVWCEVPVKHLYIKSNIDFSHGKRWVIDLVLSDKSSNTVMAIAEFKTNYDWHEDINRSLKIKNDLKIRDIYSLCCITPKPNNHVAPYAYVNNRDDIDEQTATLPQAMKYLAFSDRINIAQENGLQFSVCPIIAWLSDLM